MPTTRSTGITAAALLGITMTLLSACQRSSEPTDAPAADTAPAATQPLPIKADLDLASGDEQAILHACTRVGGLIMFLAEGRDDWAGTSVASQPWFDEKALDKRFVEMGAVMQWVYASNPEELDKYYGKPAKDGAVVEMMTENGWPDANPAVPFQLTEVAWKALDRRLVLCSSLSKGRIPDIEPAEKSAADKPPVKAPAKPRVQTPAGHPPIILEAQPE